ncbi:hypothetical protein B0H13DRAFT_1873405 [Mycena leptocephala]|nr:hypothetical protein B0H13DRAFT_1873405 [Mycena leptocephala]
MNERVEEGDRSTKARQTGVVNEEGEYINYIITNEGVGAAGVNEREDAAATGLALTGVRVENRAVLLVVIGAVTLRALDELGGEWVGAKPRSPGATQRDGEGEVAPSSDTILNNTPAATPVPVLYRPPYHLQARPAPSAHRTSSATRTASPNGRIEHGQRQHTRVRRAWGVRIKCKGKRHRVRASQREAAEEIVKKKLAQGYTVNLQGVKLNIYLRVFLDTPVWFALMKRRPHRTSDARIILGSGLAGPPYPYPYEKNSREARSTTPHPARYICPALRLASSKLQVSDQDGIHKPATSSSTPKAPDPAAWPHWNWTDWRDSSSTTSCIAPLQSAKKFSNT